MSSCLSDMWQYQLCSKLSSSQCVRVSVWSAPGHSHSWHQVHASDRLTQSNTCFWLVDQKILASDSLTQRNTDLWLVTSGGTVMEEHLSLLLVLLVMIQHWSQHQLHLIRQSALLLVTLVWLTWHHLHHQHHLHHHGRPVAPHQCIRASVKTNQDLDPEDALATVETVGRLLVTRLIRTVSGWREMRWGDAGVSLEDHLWGHPNILRPSWATLLQWRVTVTRRQDCPLPTNPGDTPSESPEHQADTWRPGLRDPVPRTVSRPVTPCWWSVVETGAPCGDTAQSQCCQTQPPLPWCGDPVLWPVTTLVVSIQAGAGDRVVRADDPVMTESVAGGGQVWRGCTETTTSPSWSARTTSTATTTSPEVRGLNNPCFWKIHLEI